MSDIYTKASAAGCSVHSTEGSFGLLVIHPDQTQGVPLLWLIARLEREGLEFVSPAGIHGYNAYNAYIVVKEKS